MTTRGLWWVALATMVLGNAGGALDGRLGAFGALVGPTKAHAQASDDERARGHFLAGTSYFEAARYAEAHDQFMEAYRLSHRVELLVNASTAAERNLDFAEAILLVDRFLSEAPAAHPARGLQTERRARLVELAARSTPTNPPPRDPVVTTQPTPDGDADGDEGSGGLGTTGWIGVGTMGAGGALGLVSIITGVVANSRYSDLDASCPDVCPASDIASGRRMARASTATTFIGVGALVGGLVLILLDDGPSTSSDATARFQLTPGPGDAGLAARWSF